MNLLRPSPSTPLSESIEKHSKSFALAAKLLPAAVRHDAQVLYAFCRYVDDAVDEAPPAVQASRLATLRRELAQVYSGEVSAEPLLQAFADVVRRRRIPQVYFDALLDGMAMDVEAVRYVELSQLLLYCYRVAGTVGLMMCHVLGVRRPQAVVHAVHLGIAMQLTNIARDVHEDWERGRLYLPDALLADHGAAGLHDALGQPWPANASPAVAEVTRELLNHAQRYYESGDRGLRDLAPRCGFGVYAARLIYSAIGSRVRAQGCDPLAGRAHVNLWRKLGWVTWAGACSVVWLPRAWHDSPVALPTQDIYDPEPLLQLSAASSSMGMLAAAARPG